MENEKAGYQPLGAAARMRDAQERARAIAGVGGAFADRLSPMTPVNEASDRAYQEPLSARIEGRLRNLANNAEDLVRMQEILKEHPEFEKFMELLTLVNRRGL